MPILEITIESKRGFPISYSHLYILLCSDDEKATSLAIHEH